MAMAKSPLDSKLDGFSLLCWLTRRYIYIPEFLFLPLVIQKDYVINLTCQDSLKDSPHIDHHLRGNIGQICYSKINGTLSDTALTPHTFCFNK